MGRTSYSNRLFADKLISIDVFLLKKYEYLSKPKSGVMVWTDPHSQKESRIRIATAFDDDGDFYLRLLYKITNEYHEVRKFDYNIYFTQTACNFSGKRFWFVCSCMRTCHKRVAKLYFVDDYFGCRHCYDLTYASRNENRKGKFWYWFKQQELEYKMDYLYLNMKRSTYNHKPTKKQLAINRIESLLHNM